MAIGEPMATPATEFFLTLEHNRLWVKYHGIHGGERSRTVSSLDDLDAFLISKASEAGVRVDDLKIFCSSTLDFPDEFTDNPAIVDMARALREAVLLLGHLRNHGVL